jgi:Zn finger protein HypA/HybF involved in hydrogenase expression
MIVRCGVCRTQFEVPGPGRYGCPACGSVNNVAGGPAPAPRPGAAPGAPPPPPPAPEPPSPRISCPECEFSFIVGRIEKATCPNCGNEVATGWTEPDGGG